MNSAIEVADHIDIDHDIVYKLHPGEYDRWREAYPWLVDAEFEVIDGPEPPLYQLFAESSVQVGVGSTAVYEGLAFDFETYVYDCPGSQVLEPLVTDGTAMKLASIEELASVLGHDMTTFDGEKNFENKATGNTCLTLNLLVRM